MLEGIVFAIAMTVEPNGLSMETALERIRVARAGGDSAVATVTVRGANRIARPVVFTAADHDIDFIGETGAMVSGGIRLGGWTDLGGGVWEADAPKLPSGETMFFDQLWVDGRRASCARLPSEGWFKVAAAKQLPGGRNGAKYTELVTLNDETAKMLAQVPKEDYPYLEVGVICRWSYGLRTLGGYNAESNSLTMASDFPWRDWKVWRPKDTLVAFFNVRSAFDAPGEWFLDMKAGKVRYRSRPGENPARLEIVVSRQEVKALLRFAGDWRKRKSVANIRFRNIAFAHVAAESSGNRPHPFDQHQAADRMDGMISLEGANGIVFDTCVFSHCAGHGLRFHSGCTSNRIVNCRISDPGAGGIWMGADNPRGPDIVRKVLKPNRPDAVAFNVISNCIITGGGRYNPEGAGVCLSHCSDTMVVHNDIFDFYYSGVSVGWSWGFGGSVSQRNDIGFNRIWDLGKGVMNDMGGVYTLGTSFGTRVHDNVIHDVRGYDYGGWGLYCDQGSEGIVEERNLVWNTMDGGFHQHYGTGCIIRNNIFAFNRKLGFVRMERAVVENIPCTLHFVNNIVCDGNGVLAGKGVRNVGGIWANNLWYDPNGAEKSALDGLTWEKWAASGKETGGVFADPLFADAKNHDFTLKPGSPALKLGFKPLDPSSAGSTLDK